MCDIEYSDITDVRRTSGIRTIPVKEAVGMVLAHDITEIRRDEFKGRAFKRGHIINEEDIGYLQRLGKERLFILKIGKNETHEDEAAHILAEALMGRGVMIEGDVKEGKVNIIADAGGLLKVNKEALNRINMIGDVMCATLHNNTVVEKGQVVAGLRAIPLVLKNIILKRVGRIADRSRKNLGGIIEVRPMRKPSTGIVITGNEVFSGKINDAFAPVITKKIESFGGEITGILFAPDNVELIEAGLKELIMAGSDLLIVTGGMSVDPDDVTRFAIRKLGANDIIYGSAALPGAMFLVAYFNGSSKLDATGNGAKKENNDSAPVPILGIPACGMYHNTTVFDLILPRVLTSEKIGRKELAELGHGGLCLNCHECRYPACPFGK